MLSVVYPFSSLSRSATNLESFSSNQGMRTSSQILIFISLQKALDAGITFFMSDNGVILTEGDDEGFLRPEFFERVGKAKGTRVYCGIATWSQHACWN